MNEKIAKTKVLILDLDGTVYIDGELIGDVKNTLNYMRKKGITIAYLTNNSSRTDEEYIGKLTRLGIFCDGDIFYSSLDAAIDYVKDVYSDSVIYPVATDDAKNRMIESGIKVGENADILLLAFDVELTYKKLVKANELLNKGVKYIATHPDNVCPAKPYSIPDVGSFIKLLEVASKRVPDVIVGKPYSVIAEYISKKFNVKKEYITMVGDRLNTDIQFGVNAGFNTVLVLSGEATREDVENYPAKPTLIVDNIDCLKEYI